MSFQHPTILLLLWILPCVAWLLVHAQRRREAAARRFVAEPMIGRLAPKLRGPRPWVKGTLVLLGLALLIIAAARPRFGVYFEKVAQRGVDCFVLLDCSRSMLAEDVAPSRLERAKSDIRDLLKKLAGDRVGLIVFAGRPVLKVPLTSDEGFFNMVLDEIDTHSAPRGGTLVGDAIRKAVDLMPPRADHDRVIVLMTDGEDQDSYPLDAAKKAAEQGVKIFTVGLGDSTEGARIPVRDAVGKLEYVKQEGREHWSKADQNVLKQIALATGGAHIPAGTRAYDLGQIYEDHLAGLTRGEAEIDGRRKQFYDRYQIPLALAIVCLVAETLIPAYPNGKRRNRRGRSGVVAPMVAVTLVFGLSGAQMPSAVAATNDAAQKVDAGIAAFRGGDFKTADQAFSEAEKAAPNELRIAFDRGCALAAQGESDKAIEQFRAAAMSKDRKLAATAHYNLGCLSIAKAKAKFGQKPEEAGEDIRKEGIETMLQGAAHLRDCLNVEPEHADARHNLETVRLWIKHIQNVWKQRDREKDRKDMNLLQFLQMLEQKQRALRGESRAAADAPMSPLHRETLRKIETAQRALADEIEPLKQKIHAAAAGPAPNTQTPGAPVAALPQQPLGEDAKKAIGLLDKLADEIRGAMNAAADSIEAGKTPEAVRSQTGAVEKIDNVFMAVAPFVDLVKKGIAAEEGLIEKSKDGTIAAKEGKQSTTKNTKDTKKEEKEKQTEKQAETDWPEAAWNQRFISRYGQVLPLKARQELEQLAKTPAGPATPATPAVPKTVSPNPQGNPAASAEEQKKAMEKALKAGIELSPEVVKLSDAAADSLDAAKPGEARPSQEKALELLKKMLPQQEQQKNDQDKKNQDKQNQDKKDQNKKDQDKKEQQKKDQDKKDQDKKDQQKKDQQKKDQEKKDQQKKDEKQDKQKDEQRTQPSKEDPSKQQAEAALRRARQRQQDRKEEEKALLKELYRQDKVDKDW